MKRFAILVIYCLLYSGKVSAVKDDGSQNSTDQNDGSIARTKVEARSTIVPIQPVTQYSTVAQQQAGSTVLTLPLTAHWSSAPSINLTVLPLSVPTTVETQSSTLPSTTPSPSQSSVLPPQSSTLNTQSLTLQSQTGMTMILSSSFSTVSAASSASEVSSSTPASLPSTVSTSTSSDQPNLPSPSSALSFSTSTLSTSTQVSSTSTSQSNSSIEQVTSVEQTSSDSNELSVSKWTQETPVSLSNELMTSTQQTSINNEKATATKLTSSKNEISTSAQLNLSERELTTSVRLTSLREQWITSEQPTSSADNSLSSIRNTSLGNTTVTSIPLTPSGDDWAASSTSQGISTSSNVNMLTSTEPVSPGNDSTTTTQPASSESTIPTSFVQASSSKDLITSVQPTSSGNDFSTRSTRLVSSTEPSSSGKSFITSSQRTPSKTVSATLLPSGSPGNKLITSAPLSASSTDILKSSTQQTSSRLALTTSSSAQTVTSSSNSIISNQQTSIDNYTTPASPGETPSQPSPSSSPSSLVVSVSSLEAAALTTSGSGPFTTQSASIVLPTSGAVSDDCHQEAHDNCSISDLKQVIELVDVMNQSGSVNATLLTTVAVRLQNLTSSNKTLTNTSLNLLVNVVSKIAQIYNDYPSLLIQKEGLDAIMGTLSNLLDDENAQTWIEMGPSQAATAVIMSINTLGDVWARQFSMNEGPITITTTNIVVQVNNTVTQSRYPQVVNLSDWTAESTGNKIIVPQQALQNLSRNGVLLTSSSYVRNLADYLPSSEINGSFLNSIITSLSIMNQTFEIFDPPINITLLHLQAITKDQRAKCTFWNFTSNTWSDENCTVLESNATHTTCSCSHLTNFAVLVSPYVPDGDIALALSIISLVGCIITIVCLFMTIIIYIVRWRMLKSHRAAVLLNLCVALIVANIIFVTGSDKTSHKDACTAVAALLHYFFLVAFFLMLVEGIQLLLYVFAVFHIHTKRQTFAMIFSAWFLPVVVVGVSLAVTKTQGYGTNLTCWLSTQPQFGLLWAFVAPALTIVAINTVIVILVLWRLSTSKIHSSHQSNKFKRLLHNILVLVPLLGITWVFGVIAVNQQLVAFQFIFAIANSLQGLFIFIFHALCTRKANESAKLSTASSKKPSSNAWKRFSANRRGDFIMLDRRTSDQVLELNMGLESESKTEDSLSEVLRGSTSVDLDQLSVGLAERRKVERRLSNLQTARDRTKRDNFIESTNSDASSTTASTFVSQSSVVEISGL